MHYLNTIGSLVTFREVFFVNVVHRKPENCGAKSCECMISVHREVCCYSRSEQDRRVVFIHLTLKGRKAYHHHAEFHRKMTDAVLDVLDEKEALVLAKEGVAGSIPVSRSLR